MKTSEISMIKKALKKATKLHEGTYRRSGQPYIIHPLEVAKISSQIHKQPEIICASLLHDTIEDTPYTKNNIINDFGTVIAELVDGVTNENESQFANKKEQIEFNRNKLIISSKKDVRVMIIKLSDRLHNMRTIEYNSEESIIKNSIETLDFFVPVANSLNIKPVKKELEDISFKCLNSELYNYILKIREEILNIYKVKQIKESLKKILNSRYVKGEVYVDIDSIRSCKNKIQKGRYDIFKIYIITEKEDQRKINDIKCDFIKVVTKEEIKRIQYGIAASNNIQKEFIDKGIDEQIIKISNEYSSKKRK